MTGFLRRRRGRPPSPGTFTPAEERLLPLLGRGLTNAEIAVELGLSVHTVHTHVANMLAKSGAADRRELGRIRLDGSAGSAWPLMRIVAGAVLCSTAAIAVTTAVLTGRSGDEGPAVARATAFTPFPTSTATPPPTPFGGPAVAELAARPLLMPTLTTADVCPLLAPRTVNPTFGPATGSGPAYLVGLTTASARPNFYHGNARPPPPYEEWGTAKTLVVIEPPEQGPVVLRGRRLDAAGTVAFEAGDAAVSQELILAAPHVGNAAGWFEDVFETLVKDPGCYAIQIDGAGFSEVIVFQAAF
jgi:DNA-binding CsgD family transcriptional regulator